jgi:hypothetical protein
MAVPTIVWSSASKKRESIRAVITERRAKPPRRGLPGVGAVMDTVVIGYFLFPFA